MESDGFVNHTAILSPAVYALLYKGRLMYIGKSTTLPARLGNHKYNKIGKAIKTPFGNNIVPQFPYDEVWIRNCSKAELSQLELEMIRKYKPKYNVRHNEEEPTATLAEIIASMITTKPMEATSIIRRL